LKGGFWLNIQYIVEASTGIEPVYTDLQSAASPLRQLAFVVREALNDLHLKDKHDCALIPGLDACPMPRNDPTLS
jgi:hypothetical protein